MRYFVNNSLTFCHSICAKKFFIYWYELIPTQCVFCRFQTQKQNRLAIFVDACLSAFKFKNITRLYKGTESKLILVQYYLKFISFQLMKNMFI